jgi:hypothetical protein
MISASRPRADILTLSKWPQRYCTSGPFKIVRPITSAVPSDLWSHRLPHPIWSRTWHGCGTEVITFRAKAARANAPVGPALTLNCRRLARLDVPNDLIDLGAIQRALYAQDGGQHDHDVAIASNHARRHRSCAMNASIASSLEQISGPALTRLPEVVAHGSSVVITPKAYAPTMRPPEEIAWS